MSASTSHKKNARGRPAKFNEARRPVTVTLPERTLRQLTDIDDDRARAIVKATDAVMCQRNSKVHAVSLVEVTPGKALVVVRPSKSLRQIPWLNFVEIAPGRNLLVIPSGTSIEAVEIALMDQIENLSQPDDSEKAFLEELRAVFVRLRRKQKISKAELIFFDVA